MDNEISKCETCIMMVIWDSNVDMTMIEIGEEVNQRFNRTWRPQTVSTFLKRLCQKKCIYMYRQGRKFFYHALIGKEDYRRKVAREFVEFWCQGDVNLSIEIINGLQVCEKESHV